MATLMHTKMFIRIMWLCLPPRLNLRRGKREGSWTWRYLENQLIIRRILSQRRNELESCHIQCSAKSSMGALRQSMFNLARLNLKNKRRRFLTAINLLMEDEGDWFYSSEWRRSGSSDGNTVFRGTSDKGNGVVTVLAHSCSKPDQRYWARTENWLAQRYAEIHPEHKANGKFRISGYQWRTLHFNEDTRQSAVKVMTAYKEEEPSVLFSMQQPHCLALPYVKSMICVGLTTILTCDCDFKSTILGKKNMNVLCVGHGGGNIPLFLASKIRGAVIDIVEIDPIVISASVKAMGFPSFSVMSTSGERVCSKPSLTDEILWKGIHERLHLYESDAEKFILDSTNLYDIVFIDAYDGEDIFPHKLWDPHSPFLKTLGKRLHPNHGTVVVNLHSNVDLTIDAFKLVDLCVSPTGKHISRVCRAYKDALLDDRDSDSGFAYTVSVPCLRNTSLVVCRGLSKSGGILDGDLVFSGLISKSFEVEKLVDLSFSCLEYIQGDFSPVD